MSTKRNRAAGSPTAAESRLSSEQASRAGPDPAETSPAADASLADERIRLAAYFLAERRGFSPGHELDDWLAAEEAVRAACESAAAAWSGAPAETPRAGAGSTRR